MRSALAIVLPLIWCAAASAQATGGSDPGEREFAFLRDQWRTLRGGFQYEGTTDYRTYLRLSTDPKRKFQKRDLAQVEASQFTLTSEGDVFDVSMRFANGEHRELHFDHDHITIFGGEQDDDVVVNRIAGQEDNFLRAPIFTPEYVWQQWIGYPWPPGSYGKPPYRVKVLSEKPEELAVETSTVVLKRDGTELTFSRQYVLKQVDKMGRLPTEIREKDPDGKTIAQVVISWSRLETASSYVPIPRKLTHRSFVYEPATGEQLLNSESSYEINEASLRLKKDDRRSSAPWRGVGERQARVEKTLSDRANAHVAVRPLLLGFVGIVSCLTVVFCTLRNRKPSGMGNAH